MRVYLLLLLAVVLAPLAQAQRGAAPEAAELFETWHREWNEAASGAESVTVRETLDRTVDGPRGDIEMRTEGRLRYARTGDPQRSVGRAELNGRRVGAPGRRRFENRTRRAYGSAAALLLRPPPLPGPFLNGASARGSTARDDVDGRPAWRLRLKVPGRGQEVTAWFTRDAEDPVLLRLRLESPKADRGQAVYEADYRRTRGLDLPSSLRTTITLLQKRRLREYTVSLRARGTYRAPDIVRE